MLANVGRGAQGYPRADMDVAAARADRHALYTLSNDHRAVTEELHTALGQLHAQRRAQGGSGARGSAEAGAAAPSAPGPRPAAAAPAPTRRGAPLANGRPASAPFAVVDSVAGGSPAGTAGVRVRALSLSLSLSSWCRSCSLPDMQVGPDTWYTREETPFPSILRRFAGARRPATRCSALAPWRTAAATRCARWRCSCRRARPHRCLGHRAGA